MSELLSIAQQFTGLPIESLIGAPLSAAAKSNATMCLTQTKFMLDTCFSKTDETLEPIMIDLILVRGVMTSGANPGDPPVISQVSTKFRLPLLTIVPINSLAVQSVDINFEMEVKSSFAEDTSKTKEKDIQAAASFEAKVGYGPFTASVKGSASYSQKDSETHNTHYQKSNSAKYTIAVHAGQLPIPKGVNIIIEAFAQCIQPIELKSSAAKSTPSPPPSPPSPSSKKAKNKKEDN